MAHPDPATDTGDEDRSQLLATTLDVAELVELLTSPGRKRPTVIMSVAGNRNPYPLPPDEIADELNGIADVYVLATTRLAWELDGHPEFRTYGGAVRVIGADGFGAVIRTDGDLDSAFDRIVTVAEKAGRRMHGSRVAPPAVLQPVPSREQDVVVHLERERDKRVSAEERATAATRELAAARAEAERLRNELDALTAPLFSDPEEQFRDDVTRCWLRQIAEPERPRWALREFQVGPAFLDHLDMPQAPRVKILEVVVDVLTRRAFEMPSRSVRAHGNGGSAGVNGQMVRADGASAYRCNIRANTPQAPRLMWWELTDGTVELALAGHHDDPMPAPC